MKKITFLLLLSLTIPGLHSAKAQDICAQVITTAVSPDNVCQVFPTPCDVPEDWKSVPSCEVIGDNDTGQSLERKMNSRLAQMRAYWQAKKARQANQDAGRSNETFNRFGSGALTRSDRNRRLPTSEDNNIKGAKRTFTDKNYNSDIAERYSLRGGYQRPGDTTAEERKARRQVRPSYHSRTDVKRDGKLNTTVRWNVLSKQFTTKKSYGVNPYRLRAQHIAEQKAARDATNREIDVYKRKLSRSRKYRGGRLEGNLSGEALKNREQTTTE